MKILSLDQALQTTGYCIWEDNKPIKWGTFKTTNTFPIDKRLRQIWDFLDDISKIYDFTLIAFEDCQQQQNAQTYHKLSMVKAIILLWCNINNKIFAIYSPSSWRNLCGGGYGRKREEQKEIAINKVKEWYNIDANSDICDAINIGRAAIIDLGYNQSAF